MGFSRLRLPRAEYAALCAAVRKRDGNRCRKCGATDGWFPLAAHHIVWRSRGGKDTAENLIMLCPPHHDAIHGGKMWIVGDAESAEFVTENPRGKLPVFKK